jgi:hypothetical protein
MLGVRSWRVSTVWVVALAAASGIACNSKKADEAPTAPASATQPSGNALTAVTNPAGASQGASPAAQHGTADATGTACGADQIRAADPVKCAACEAPNCDAEAHCSSFTSQSDRDRCNAVLECARRTGCLLNTSVDCYCGVGVDVVTCRGSAANATGACKAEITAGMPSGASAAQIVSSLTDVKVPAGNALNLVQCDVSYCGERQFRGKNECIPYCKPAK